MAISAIQPGTGVNSNNPVASGDLSKEAFLKLLTTQLQHQDPLEPASDVEFIQQMATFAQLEQQQLTNSNLQLLGLYESSINNSNALNLVGKEVKIQDPMVDHAEGQTHSFYYEGADEAARVHISVTDEDGREVFTQTQVGSTDGEQEFIWHGQGSDGEQVEAGTYKVTISLEDKDGKKFTAPIYQHEKVKGISYENGSILALVGDKRIPIENIVEVYGGAGGGGGSSGDSSTGDPNPFKNGFAKGGFHMGQLIPFPGKLNPYNPLGRNFAGGN